MTTRHIHNHLHPELNKITEEVFLAVESTDSETVEDIVRQTIVELANRSVITIVEWDGNGWIAVGAPFYNDELDEGVLGDDTPPEENQEP